LILLKSLLAGFVALVLAVIATAVTIVISLSIKGRNLPQGEGYGWDPVSIFRNSLVVWVVLALAFVIGFAWEYRRAMPHH
jgi:uncharacterized membrane protein YjgN (DUF898 family)